MHHAMILGNYTQLAHDTTQQSVSPDDEHDMLETCREL